MSKEVVLNQDKLQRLACKKEWIVLAKELRESFRVEKGPDGIFLSLKASEKDLENLCYYFVAVVGLVEESPEKELILIDILVALRNCATNPDNHRCFCDNKDFLDNLLRLYHFCQDGKASNSNLNKILIQFIINLIAADKGTSSIVYNLLYDCIKASILKNECVYEVSALFYNLFLNLKEIEVCFDICDSILRQYLENHNEFLQFTVEGFLEKDFLWLYFPDFSIDKRLAVLELVREKQLKGDDINFPKSALTLFNERFVKSGDAILKTNLTELVDDMEPYEVSLLLEIISCCASKEQYLKYFQSQSDLLVNAGALLLNVHRLGKQSCNHFSVIQKLSELKNPASDVKDHPSFGFKVGLVRLIGNLCWKNKEMQDLARMADLIPVLLDCCNIDARNPFIIQWVIFTVRNLCENNKENQAIIADLHQEGTVSSAVLQELGMTLHSDGDKNELKIISLDALRNKNENK